MSVSLGLRVAFGVSLLALVSATALAWEARVAADAHARYARDLRAAVELDAQLNEQVAESHMGFVTHYDDLVRTWDRVVANRSALDRLPRHLHGPSRDALVAALGPLEEAVRSKQVDLERFKSDRAVLRNAEHALPVSVARLQAALARAGTAEEQERFSALLDDLLLQVVSPEPERGARAACSLALIAPHIGPPPAGCPDEGRWLVHDQPELRDLAGSVRQLGELVLERGPLTEARVRALMTAPVADQALRAAARYDVAHAEAVDRSQRRVRSAEGLLAISLLLGAGLIIARIQRDAVALRRTTEQLETANEALRAEVDREAELARLKSRFVSMTSHEFRTPLSVILSSAELLEAYGHRWNLEGQHKHLHRISQSGRAMSAMIDRVLVIGRADAELLEVKPEELVPVALALEVVEELRSGPGAGRRIELLEEGGAAPRRLDPRLLRHVLENLLTNALKYSPDHAPVRLRVSDDAGGVRFDVVDEGIGIPAEDREMLFEPFHRCGNAADIPGTGLGLAIVRRAVDAHGGSIEVDSAPGRGTTFRVRVPELKEIG
jgi:signal transduction histidine kinase